MRLSVSKAARREAEAAVRWYEAREDGLGLALVTEDRKNRPAHRGSANDVALTSE